MMLDVVVKTRETYSTIGTVRARPHYPGVTQDTQPITEISWEYSACYLDEPMDWRTRLFGVGGVVTIMALVAFCALFTWTSYHVAPQPTVLTVFNVALPAAPPEPENEMPPGPEQVERDQPQIELPKIEPPEIEIARDTPVPLPVLTPRPPDPGPLVERTTAPDSQPAPPAPEVSTGQPTWEGLVLGALNKKKRYPREAQFRRQQGVPWIRFVMDRDGKVLSVQLERSSGVRALDDEAVALPKRAAPLPKPPADVTGERIELVVPIEFFITGVR